MGDYLLLQWLGTRRGLAVFVLLVLVTVFSNLCRFSDRERAKQIQSPAKVELKRLAQFGRPKPKQLPVLCQVAGLDGAEHPVHTF